MPRVPILKRLVFRLRPEDWVLLAFLTLFAIFLAVFRGSLYLYHSSVRGPMYVLAFMVALNLVLRAPGLFGASRTTLLEMARSTGGMLRDWMPFILCFLVYENFHDMTNLIHGPETVDRWLAQIDQWIFGVQPTLWLQRFTHPLLTDYLSFAYSLYILIPATLAGILYVKGRIGDFREVMLGLLFAFYIGFAGYIVVPAVGPRAILDIRYEDPMYLSGIAFYRSFSAMWNDLQSFQRDCFPSLHIGISSVILFFSYKFHDLFRIKRILFWCLLPFVVSLWFATIYLRYHWVIDAIAGWSLAAFCFWFSPKVEAFWNRQRERAGIPAMSQRLVIGAPRE